MFSFLLAVLRIACFSLGSACLLVIYRFSIYLMDKNPFALHTLKRASGNFVKDWKLGREGVLSAEFEHYLVVQELPDSIHL